MALNAEEQTQRQRQILCNTVDKKFSFASIGASLR